MSLTDFSLVSFLAVFFLVLIAMLSMSRMVFRGAMRNAGYAFAILASLTTVSMLSSGWILSILSIIVVLLVSLFVGTFLILTVNWAKYRLQLFRLQTRLARDYSRRDFRRIFRYDPRTNRLDMGQ